MIPVLGCKGQKIVVLGLGRSGMAAARALRAGGAEVLGWDDGAPARDRAEGEGFTLHDPMRPRGFEGVAALIASPGIPHLYPAPHPAIARAMEEGVPVDNDIGLFFRSFATPAWDQFGQEPKVVCVTGSNGKSTTSALIHHILVEAGRDAQLGGNIGRGVLDLDPARSGLVTVLELSSYQTELARTLQPDIAVFLNLSPDHLGRHGGTGGYFAAKARLFTLGGPERAVIGLGEAEGRFLANQLAEGPDRVIALSDRNRPGTGWQVVHRKGFVAEWRHGRQTASADLRGIASLPGAHNHQNAAAAWAVCRTLGLSPREVEAGLRTYPGLPHRCQTVREIAGVRFVNDSKATNADAAGKALSAFDRIHWILGGEAKEGGIESLRPHFSRIARAYLIGAAAAEFAATLDGTPHVSCSTLDRALAKAAKAARAGEVVLLAPACASFDQFRDFEERGEVFTRLVMALPSG